MKQSRIMMDEDDGWFEPWTPNYHVHIPKSVMTRERLLYWIRTVLTSWLWLIESLCLTAIHSSTFTPKYFVILHMVVLWKWTTSRTWLDPNTPRHHPCIQTPKERFVMPYMSDPNPIPTGIGWLYPKNTAAAAPKQNESCVWPIFKVNMYADHDYPLVDGRVFMCFHCGPTQT